MLQEFISTDIYKLLLLFSRLGATMMLLPGIGSGLVYVRARLILALAIAFLLLPSLRGVLPAMPADPLAMFLLLFTEATIGLFMGTVTMILMSPLDLAANSIGYSVGLTNMFTLDPITSQQSQLMVGFLNLTAMTIVFASDAHHLMIRAIVDSYTLFTPGQVLPTDDFSAHLVKLMGESLVMGFRMAAPLVVFALSFNTALGLLNRMVPQIPVFLVGLPIQIMCGLIVLALTMPIIMYWVIVFLDNGLAPFGGG
jgi:flagellar biosynthetic protein FliR